MIEFFALRSQAGFYISQAFAIRQLCESHNAEMINAGKVLHAEVALMFCNATLKGFQRHEVHNLGKHKWA